MNTQTEFLVVQWTRQLKEIHLIVPSGKQISIFFSHTHFFGVYLGLCNPLVNSTKDGRGKLLSSAILKPTGSIFFFLSLCELNQHSHFTPNTGSNGVYGKPQHTKKELFLEQKSCIFAQVCSTSLLQTAAVDKVCFVCPIMMSTPLNYLVQWSTARNSSGSE